MFWRVLLLPRPPVFGGGGVARLIAPALKRRSGLIPPPDCLCLHARLSSCSTSLVRSLALPLFSIPLSCTLSVSCLLFLCSSLCFCFAFFFFLACPCGFVFVLSFLLLLTPHGAKLADFEFVCSRAYLLPACTNKPFSNSSPCPCVLVSLHCWVQTHLSGSLPKFERACSNPIITITTSLSWFLTNFCNLLHMFKIFLQPHSQTTFDTIFL